MKRIGAVALFVAGAACLAQSRDSPASRVLLVYVENSPESVAVADVYAEKRGIPATNLCAISLPDRVATVLGAAEYDETVKTPVRACLETVGKQHILYIVLSYVRPYAVDPGAGLGKYALDSYLADIWDEYATQHFNPAPQRPHPYYVDNQAQGNFFHSFMSLAEFRKQDDVPLFYSVWRLDGSTPEIVTGLVDNAIYAETHGLAGQACIDALADPTGSPDSSYRATDWDLYRAAQALRRAGFSVQEDQLETEFGNEPSPATCSDAALYAGWYSVNNYYDVFTWVPGAIGFHLDSNSALDPREGANWSANALNRGVTVTSGAIAEPYLEGMPRASGVFRNLLQGATVGDAFLRNTRWLKWHILDIGDPLYRPFPDGLEPFNTALGENALAVFARNVVEGEVVNAAVVVDAPAPEGGRTVTFGVDAGSPISVPESVVIPKDATFAVFPMSIGLVPSPATTQIIADNGIEILKNTVTVYPVLAALRVAAQALRGGESLRAMVVLNRLAPADGFTIALSTDRPDVVKVPATLLVAAGTNRAEFQIDTATVQEQATARITATFTAAEVSTAITLTP